MPDEHELTRELMEGAVDFDDASAVYLGPEIDYDGYRDRDLARLISEVPILAGRLPESGSIVLISYLRAEPMHIVIDETGASSYDEALESMRDDRADAVLVLAVIDGRDRKMLHDLAERSSAVVARIKHESMHPFALIVDDFGRGGKWVRLDHVDDLPWDQLSLRRKTKNWHYAPRTQAAIRARAITPPNSSSKLDRWAPATTGHSATAISPSDADSYRQYTMALSAVVAGRLDDIDHQDQAILAATAAEQIGEFIGAYSGTEDALDRCLSDLAKLASRSRGRTRSRLLSAAAALLRSAGRDEQAKTVLLAVDDIAVTAGRTPLSEAVRLTIEGELDEEGFAHALSLSDITSLA